MLIGRSVTPSSHPRDTVRGRSDRATVVTSICVLTVYVLPPFIDEDGHVYSVAELIAAGDACLVSSGGVEAIPTDVEPLFKERQSEFSHDACEVERQ